MKRTKMLVFTLLFAMVITAGSFAFMGEKTSVNAAEPTVITVTEEGQLRAYRADETDKIFNIDADSLIVTDYIRLNFGNNIIRPAENRSRVTLTFSKLDAYALYIGDAVYTRTTFQNIDLVIENGTYATPFYAAAACDIVFDNCTITYSGTATRPLSGGSVASKLVFINTTVSVSAGTNNTFYRGEVVLAGTAEITPFTVGSASNMAIRDYRDYEVTDSEDAGLITFTVTGEGKYGNALPLASTMTGEELYYTTDGSDPITNPSAVLYEGPFAKPSAENAIVRVGIKATSGAVTEFSPLSYSFKYNEMNYAPDVTASDLVIDYAAETLSFDSDIEVNSADTFDGTAFVSGSAVEPGSVWYARHSSDGYDGYGNVYTLNVDARPATPAEVEAASVTKTTIKLTAITGAEYSCTQVNSGAWQDSTDFSGLTSDTAYNFSVRIKATASKFKSSAATAVIRTAAALTEVSPVDFTISYTAETVSFNDEVIEGRTNADFTLGNPIVSGGSVTPGTKIYLRYKDVSEPGPSTEFDVKDRPVFTTAPVLFVANNTIIEIKTIAGAEYAIRAKTSSDAFVWGSAISFKELTQATMYTVAARLKATSSEFASLSTTADMTTLTSERAVWETDDFATLKAALETKSFVRKAIYLTGDITATSGLSIPSDASFIQDVLIEPKAATGMVKIQSTFTDTYLINQYRFSTLTMNRLHLVHESNATATRALFYCSVSGVEETYTYINDSIIENTGDYRTIHPAQAQCRLYLHNVEIDDATAVASIYRGFVSLSGTTSYKSGLGSSAVVDYRDVNIQAVMSADFKVTLSLSKAPVNLGAAAPEIVMANIKLYYTLDGTDPLTSGTAVEYVDGTTVISAAQLIRLKVALADKTSAFKHALGAAQQYYFFSYTVNYIDRTLGFNPSEVNLSETEGNFTNLLANNAAVTPGQVIYGRLAADIGNTFTIKIPEAPATPVDIVMVSRTNNRISVTAAAGVEYKLNDGEWVGTNVFTDLTAATAYTVHYRLKATATSFYSPEDIIEITTMGKQATPVVTDFTINYSTFAITFGSGIELNSSSTFAEGTVILSGAAIQPGMSLFARRTATTENVISEVLSFSVASKPAAPETATFTADKNSVKFTAIAGAEYMIVTGEDDEWVDSPDFLGLPSDTEFTFRIRFKATSTSFASDYYEVSVSTKKAVETTPPKKGCSSSVLTLSLPLLGGGLLLLGAMCLLLKGRNKADSEG